MIGVFFKDKCAWLDKEHGSFLITQTKCAGFFFYNYVCVFNCFVVINLSIHISSLNSGADRLDCYRMNVETYLTQQCTSNWRGYNCMRFISHSVFLCKFIKKKKIFSEEGCTRNIYFGRTQRFIFKFRKKCVLFYSLYLGLWYNFWEVNIFLFHFVNLFFSTEILIMYFTKLHLFA